METVRISFFKRLEYMKKRLDFLNKKRDHLSHFKTKINYRKPKKERLERHYRIHLKAIEQEKMFSKLTKTLLDMVVESLSRYEQPPYKKHIS